MVLIRMRCKNLLNTKAIPKKKKKRVNTNNQQDIFTKHLKKHQFLKYIRKPVHLHVIFINDQTYRKHKLKPEIKKEQPLPNKKRKTQQTNKQCIRMLIYQDFLSSFTSPCIKSSKLQSLLIPQLLTNFGSSLLPLNSMLPVLYLG